MKKLKAISGFFLVLGFFFLVSANKVLAAGSISYESPQYYEIGKEISPLSPTISGNDYTFSISPSLPNGLSINSSTGVISGTPYVLSLSKNYVVTATNGQENQVFNLNLATLFKPTSFSYFDPIRFFTINRLITNTLTTSAQEGVTYSISPELPDGLYINSTTGEISGFATEISGLISYVVSASNALGVATTSVSIAVPMPWTGVGGDIISSGASQPFLNLVYNNSNVYIPYVVYSNQLESSIVVVRYDYLTKTWVQVGNTINNVSGEQNKIIFDSNKTPYISYISNGGIFIKKYNNQTNKWESLSSAYNSSNQEIGSALSNAASNHDIIINPSNNVYEAYIDNDSLNIDKLIDSPAEYSTIDNLEMESTISNFSYGTSSVVFGSGSKINPLYPSLNNSKPASFTVSPNLPAGLNININSGVIYGTPLMAAGETVYSIVSKNDVSVATTTISIKILGPWENIATEMPQNNFNRLFAQAKNGDIYLSYFSENIEVNSKTNQISKYSLATASWTDIYSCEETTINYLDGIIDSEVITAITAKDNDLYVVVSKDDINYSDEENQYATSIIYIKKYDALSNTWSTLGEMQNSVISPFMDAAEVKIAFAGNDLFLAYYFDGYIKIYKFNEADGAFSSIANADFYPGSPFNYLDNKLFIGDANNLYLAYSEMDNETGSNNFVVMVMNQAGIWSKYIDDELFVNSIQPTSLSMDSLRVDNNGKIYISYNYSGADNTVKSIIKKLDPTLGTFTEIFSETDSLGVLKNILSLDQENNLWSSSGVSNATGYFFRKIGTSTTEFTEKQFVGYPDDIKYPELFFDLNNDVYVFAEKNVFLLAKYTEVEAPINYDYSITPTISYPKQVYTYVTGKRINPIYPFITGSAESDFNVINDSNFPLGLSGSNGAIFGTPLIATTTTLKMSVSNITGSSSIEITLNIIDPWSPLGAPLSSSAKSVSLGVDANSKLYVAYSETINSINRVLVSKYDNETWNVFSNQVSDDSISSSYPKIYNYYNDIYLVYREDVSKKLIVKKYNSQTEYWDNIGSAVTDYSSAYFDISIEDGQISVVYYDDINNRSLVKTYIDDYWVVTGGYLEQGKNPTLYKNNNKIYTAYSNDSGAVKVVSYEEINYADSGKEVSLNEVSSLIESGDMSPQGSISATSTPAIKFNQKIKLIPFTGASVLIPSGTIMTASESFDSSLLTSSSTVDLLGINSSFTPIGTMMFGLPDLGLNLSTPITISIPVTGVAENTQLQVYSKTAGGAWNSLTTCYVVAGKCSFQTSHLSEFAAGTVVVPSGGGGGGYIDPVKPTCSSVTYSDFSDICSNGYLTRNILTQLPTGCSLSAIQIEAAKKACTLLIEDLESATSTIATSTDNVTTNLLKEIRDKFIALEKSLIKKINKLLTKKLLGRILLQVESRGEAWYLDPISTTRYYLADGENAYNALKQFGLGITDNNLAKIPVGSYSYKGSADTDQDGLSDKIENGLGTDPNLADTDKDGVKDGDEVLKKNTNPLNTKKLSYSKTLINKLKGRIVIQTEKRGEAWYINPADGKRYYLADGETAYQIMRYLSLGINNANIRQINIGDLK